MPFGPGGGGMQSTLIFVGVALLVIVLRNSRPRKLKIERLWIYPVILFLALVGSLAANPPPVTVISIGLLVLGLIIGAGLGWQRGRFTRIDIHPETHDLTSRASPVGLIFIFAIFALRYGLRDLLTENASFLHIPVIAAGEAVVVLGIAMLTTQRLELWLRARRMLAEAQAAKAAPPTTSPPIVS
ncbi:MAG: hypothetical protein ACHP7N_17605 [Caulobacterales bacterium]